MNRMKNILEILKHILMPFIEKNGEYDENIDINWKSILDGFIRFENEPQILVDKIEKLNIKDSNITISKLSKLHDDFMGELAEDYVLGNSSEIANKLLSENNNLFTEKVKSFSTLKGVITKMERIRIIDELKADNAIADESIELAFKKKGREEIKARFKEWDKELEDEKINKPKGKLISLFSTKIAIAASIALLIGFSIFKTFNTNTYSFQAKVLSQRGMGFASENTSKVVEVVFEGPSGLFKSKSKNEYTFFNNILTIYSQKSQGQFHFLELDNNQFYILLNNDFYHLKETEIPLSLEKENDINIKKQLEKIIFVNE